MSGLTVPLISEQERSEMGDRKEEPAELPPAILPPSKSELNMYNFENYYCTDPNAKPVIVAVSNLTCVAILTVCFYLTGNLSDLKGAHRFLELTWMSFAVMGPGGGADPDGWLWSTRMVMIMASFMKMIAFSLLVSFLDDAIASRMDDLFAGKSRVLEENFVLILGWSDKILPVVNQLVLANESDGGAPIVIMADVLEKPEMDAILMDNIEDWLGSKPVTRPGNPINPNSLVFCSAPTARSIIILSQGFDPDEADSQACRAVLAVTGGLEYMPTGHVVVELRDSDNVPVVRLGISDNMCSTQEEKNRRVLPLVGANMIGRLMVQCSFEPGLARIFDHILDFSGNEFYFSNWDAQLAGHKFADACFSFEDAICFGICTAQLDSTGRRIFLNPPGDTLIQSGDQLIFIAEDNDTYTCAESVRLTSPGKPPDVKEDAKSGTRMLLIGWRRDMHEMVIEVDKWSQPGSALTILCDFPCDRMSYAAAEGKTKEETLIEEHIAELESADCNPGALTNIVLTNIIGSTIVRSGLIDAEVFNFHSVIILTQAEENKEGIKSDSKSMVTMLLCRDIQREGNSAEKFGREPFLVAEILDPRTASLIKLASANDFMVSNLLISQALAQMSQEINIHALLEDLFCPEGCEMHIKPIRLYQSLGENLSFWDIVARARMRCEIAFGYYNVDNELVLNPPNKSDPIEWREGDRLVVLSED